MNFLIKYKTILGDIWIDENFDCWHGEKKFCSGQHNNIEDAKMECGGYYSAKKQQKIDRLETELKRVKESPWDITNTPTEI